MSTRRMFCTLALSAAAALAQVALAESGVLQVQAQAAVAPMSSLNDAAWMQTPNAGDAVIRAVDSSRIAGPAFEPPHAPGAPVI